MHVMENFLVRGSTLVHLIALIWVIVPTFGYSLDEPTVLSSAMSQVSGERMLADVTTLSRNFNGRQAGRRTIFDPRSGLRTVCNRLA
jgi:hypothetical protein